MTRCACLEFRHRRLSTLSGGERQRVLLAACLAQQPRLLLLDEPATYLDIDQQLHCFTLLREEASRGAACLAVTHDLNLALTFCTRLLILADRTIAHDVPVAAALDHPEWLSLFSPRLTVTRTSPVIPGSRSRADQVVARLVRAGPRDRLRSYQLLASAVFVAEADDIAVPALRF